MRNGGHGEKIKEKIKEKNEIALHMNVSMFVFNLFLFSVATVTLFTPPCEPPLGA